MSTRSFIQELDPVTDTRGAVPLCATIAAPPAPAKSSRQGSIGPMERGGLLAIWRRLAVFAIGQTIIIVLIEVALRAQSGPSTAPTSEPYRDPSPYVEFFQKPNYEGHGIRTNSVGFRYDELPIAKPPNETRIFFLSTSVGFHGRTNATTIPGLMEAALDTLPDHRIRVVNASGVSFCSTQSLVLLVTRLVEYAPDVLVIFHGPEALFFPSDHESRAGFPFNFGVREGMHQALTTSPDPFNPVSSWLAQSQIARRYHPTWRETQLLSTYAVPTNVVEFTSLSQYDPYIDVAANDIKKMIRIASSDGIRTLVGVPPSKHPRILPGALQEFDDRIQLVVEREVDHQARFVNTLELSSAISKSMSWKSDGVHWTQTGNEIMADVLVQALLNSEWLDTVE